MRRITLIVLIASIFNFIFSINVFAYYDDDEQKNYGGYEEYSGYTGDCTWDYNEMTYTLTISGNGRMENYDNGEDVPWCDQEIDKVIINSGVTSIGDHCFERVYGNVGRGFSTVSLPSSITRIGNYAFAECVFLASIVVPDNVTDVGSKAFYSTNLNKVTLPKGIKRIASDAFEDTTIKNVHFKGTKKQWKNFIKKQV